MKNNFITKEVLETLSPLESDVINIMDFDRGYRVKELYNLVKKKKKVAKSSISVILDRLYKNGLVKRHTENAKGGIRFIYRLEEDKERFERRIVDRTIATLLDKFGSKAIVYFNDSLAKKRRG